MRCYLTIITVLLAAVLQARLGSGEEISFLHVDTREEDSSEFGAGRGPRDTSCPCGWANKAVSRIVGGKTTLKNEYPFVGVVKDKYTPFMICGATIVSPWHALTGAHCTWRRRVEGDPIVLVIGEHDINEDSISRMVMDVAKIIEHENFNRITLINDIAILVLSTKINFNQLVGPACLPTSIPDLSHKYVKILGWGNTKASGEPSTTLLQLIVRVVPLKPCSYSYPGRVSSSAGTHLCTYRRSKSSCQGDSGGPVVWRDPETNRYTLVGIVSFGNKCASTTPTVNTYIPPYINWIQDKIQETNPEADVCKKI